MHGSEREDVTMKAVILTLVATLTLALAAVGEAAVIATWSADLDAIFVPPTVFSAGGGVTTAEPKELSWGDAVSPRSRLLFGDALTAVPLETNGPAIDGVPLTHENRILSLDVATLQSGTILLSVDLTSVPPGDASSLSFERTLRFIETDNNAVPCPAGDGQPCDDFLVFSNASLEESQFVIDDTLYTLVVSLDGLTPLSSEACATLGFAAGCRGLITIEDADNLFTPQVRLVAQAIPAPGAWLLLLAGGAGLLTTVRRRR
jgi:hypothetical protein